MNLKPASAFAVACPLLYPPPYDGGGDERAPNKNAGASPAFPFVQVAVSGLLIVVEPTLARLVITLAARPVGRTLVPSSGPGDFAAATTVETAARRRRTAGEVGAPVAHRAAVATTTATGAGAAVTTAATAAAVTAAAVAAATTAAAIATATAATVAATTTAAAAVGRTRTTRTEAATLATAATTAA